MADINYPIANNDEFTQHKLDYVSLKNNLDRRVLDWEMGTISGATGEDTVDSRRIRTKDILIYKGDVLYFNNTDNKYKYIIFKYPLDGNFTTTGWIRDNSYAFEEDVTIRLVFSYNDNQIIPVGDIYILSRKLTIINSTEEEILSSKISTSLPLNIYDCYLRGYCTFAGGILKIFKTVSARGHVYWLEFGKKYEMEHVLLQSEYVLNHNQYLALNPVTKLVTIKDITLDTRDYNEIILALNIEGDLIAGVFREFLKPTQPNNVTFTKSIKNFVSKTQVQGSAPNGSTVVGDELWTFDASNDSHTNFARCIRYAINPDTFDLTYAGEFTHNWGHVNSIAYCEENDTLICGNGSGDYNLTGKIIILPQATSFTSKTSVDINIDAVVIDVESMNWGAKTNVIWGESNDGNNNIAYVFTNDNKNIRRILLGKGTTELEHGQFITDKTADEYNGTFKVLNEYSQDDGDDVLQDAHFGNDGYIYIGLGHSGLWYAKLWLNPDGSISKETTRTQLYNDDGTIISSYMESISEYKGRLLLRVVVGGAIWVYVIEK